LSSIATRALATLGAAATLSCGSSDILEPAQDPPELERFSFWSQVYYGNSPPEGVLFIESVVPDAAFRAAAHSDFPFEVRSSSGDLELASLRKTICGPDEEGGRWLCDEIAVFMREGRSVLDIYPHVKAMNGRLRAISPTLRSAAIPLFGRTPLDVAVSTASRWPGVDHATYSYVGFQDGDGHVARIISASVKLDLTAPIVGNGVLEANEGDTITVKYVQPDGSLLTQDWILPARPQ
jgi:hypothetical protein